MSDVFAALPTPVQAAGIALAGIAVAARPVRAGIELLRDGVSLLRSAFDRAAIGAFDMAGNLKGVSLGLGAVGLAATAATIIFQNYIREKTRAAKIESELTDILLDQSGAWRENADVYLGSQILKGELGETLRKASVDLGSLTKGIRDNAEAVGQLSDLDSQLIVRDLGRALRDAGLEGSEFATELRRVAGSGELSNSEIVRLVHTVGDLGDQYETASREADNTRAANEAFGHSSDESSNKVSRLGEAAKEAKEEISRLRQETDDTTRSLERQFAAITGQLDAERGAEDAVRAVGSAERRIAEIRAEGAAAEKDRADRIREAEQRIADIRSSAAAREEQRARRIRDAREALADVEAKIAGGDLEGEAAARARRDASERLSDAEKDTAEVSRDLADAQQRLAEAKSETVDVSRDLEQAQLDLEDAQIRSAEAAARLEENQREASGETLTAADRATILAGKYGELAGTLAPDAPLRTRLAELKTQLEQTAGDYTATVKLNTEQAKAQLDNVAADLWRVMQDTFGSGPPSQMRPLSTGSTGGAGFRFHDGVEVVPGHPGTEVPAVLKAGEGVVSEREMATLRSGGPSSQVFYLTINNPVAEPASTSMRALDRSSLASGDHL